MKKKISVFTIAIGIILFIAGLATQIPKKELTTYSFMEDECSVIEEYVGGDAYNYIIGAALVGGEIAGAKTQKAIYISAGLLLICLGLYAFASQTENDRVLALTETPKSDFMSEDTVNETELLCEKEETTIIEEVSIEETPNNEL